MKKFGQSARPTRREGVVIAMVALSLVAIMSVVAIAVDGGVLLNRRRDAQSAADAAAMAAACVLYAEYPQYQGTDRNWLARYAAYRVAAENGYTNNTRILSDDSNEPGSGAGANSNDTTTVTVNIPPATGPYAGKAGFAEVIVTYFQPRFFSRVLGSGNIRITARAVARGAWAANGIGVLVLDYTGRSALNSQGNGSFTETGGNVIVNSNHDEAVVDGGNGTMRADRFFITGNASVNGGGQLETYPIPGQVFVGVHPTPDPLAYLPPPQMPPDGIITVSDIGMGNKRYELTPGRFSNLPQFNSGDEVILKQASANENDGIYYIDGGGFKSTGATIKMDPSTSGGVMIYNVPSSTALSEKLQITGNSSGSVELTPLTSGPYSGMMLWQERNSTVPAIVEGNGNFTVKGSFYFASALLSVSGNGGTFSGDDGEIIQGSRIGSQFIVKDLALSGNGNIYLKYKDSPSAPARILALVE